MLARFGKLAKLELAMAKLIQSLGLLLLIALVFSEALSTPADGLSAATRRFEASWSAMGIKSNSGLRHALFSYPCVGEIKGLLKKGVQKGPILLEVPSSTVLSLRDRDKSPIGMSGELWASLKLTTKLSLLLLTEFLKGDASKHNEYIDTLREEKLLTPIRWSEPTLSALRESYPSLSLACEKQRKDYNKLHGILTTGPSSPFSPSAVPFELFLWAMEAVRSRAFQGLGGSSGGEGGGFLAPIVAVALVVVAFFADRTNLGGDGLVVPVGLATGAMLVLLPSLVRSQQGNCALLPAIDSCNHDSSKYSGDVTFDPVASAYQLRECGNRDRGEDDAQGRELTISYGQRDNDELLQYFGFVEVGNPHDKATVALPSPGANAAAALSFATVNRKGRESWVVPAGVSDEQLRAVLQSEADTLGRAVERLVAAASPRSEAEGAAEVRERCLLVEFLKQKGSVISDAANRV